MQCSCVLLADSHPEMLGAVQVLLRDLFDTVVMVADESSLLSAIPSLHPDLVIVDLSLPVAGSRNIVTRCCEAFPALAVIVLSVHDESEAVATTVRAGAQGFILKRTAGTELAEAVAVVLGGGTYVSPGVGTRTG